MQPWKFTSDCPIKNDCFSGWRAHFTRHWGKGREQFKHTDSWWEQKKSHQGRDQVRKHHHHPSDWKVSSHKGFGRISLGTKKFGKEMNESWQFIISTTRRWTIFDTTTNTCNRQDLATWKSRLRLRVLYQDDVIPQNPRIRKYNVS